MQRSTIARKLRWLTHQYPRDPDAVAAVVEIAAVALGEDANELMGEDAAPFEKYIHWLAREVRKVLRSGASQERKSEQLAALGRRFDGMVRTLRIIGEHPSRVVR